MATQGGKHLFRCPCYDYHSEYQKIVDLKDAGLVIYRKTIRNEGGSIKDLNQANTSQSASNEDIFILHNTKEVEILSADIMPAFDENKISCPRCRRIFENAQNLLKTIPKINRNDIMGICDHCRRKLSRSPCQRCDEIVKQFVSSTDEVKDTKKQVKVWLTKIRKLLKDVITGDKNVKKQKSMLSGIDLRNLHHNSPVSLREPEVTDLFNYDKMRTASTKTLYMSDRSHSLPGFPKTKKKTTFLDYLGIEEIHLGPGKTRRFHSKSDEDLAYSGFATSSLDELRRGDYLERKSSTDLRQQRNLKKSYMSTISDVTPGNHYSEDILIPIQKQRYTSEETLKSHGKRPPENRETAHGKYKKHTLHEILKTHRQYSSEEKLTTYGQHLSEDRLTLYKKHKSEETLLTSITGIVEDYLKQDFGYFFPHTVDEKVKAPKKRVSSSQLIKDTTDMLKERAEKERLRLEEVQRKKKEDQEKKAQEREQRRLLREEAKKRAEEAKRLAEEAKRLAEEQERKREEMKKLAEEEARALENKRLAEEQKLHAKSKSKFESVKKAKEISVKKTKESSEHVEKAKIKESPSVKTKTKEPPPVKTKIKEVPPEKPKKESLLEKPKEKETVAAPKPIKQIPEKPEQSKQKEPSRENIKTKEQPQDKTRNKEPITEKPVVKEAPPEKPVAKEALTEKPVVEVLPEKPITKEKLPEKTKVQEPTLEAHRARDTLADKSEEPPLKPKLKDKPEPIVKEKEIKKEKEQPKEKDEEIVKEKPKPVSKPEPGMAGDFKKLLEEQAKMKQEEQRLKKQREEDERKARMEAEKKLKEMEQHDKSSALKAKKEEAEKPIDESPGKKQEPPTTKDLNIKQIKVREPSVDDLILKLVKLKQENRSERTKKPLDVDIDNLIFKHKGHKSMKDDHCLVCTRSDVELDIESIKREREDIKMADIIIGPKIFKYKPPIQPVAGIKQQDEIKLPIVFKTDYNEDKDGVVERIPQATPEYVSDEVQHKNLPLEPAKGTAAKGKQLPEHSGGCKGLPDELDIIVMTPDESVCATDFEFQC